jgi:sulfite exporter TauE/SafE
MHSFVLETHCVAVCGGLPTWLIDTMQSSAK